jgi:hypothetical protein
LALLWHFARIRFLVVIPKRGDGDQWHGMRFGFQEINSRCYATDRRFIYTFHRHFQKKDPEYHEP